MGVKCHRIIQSGGCGRVADSGEVRTGRRSGGPCLVWEGLPSCYHSGNSYRPLRRHDDMSDTYTLSLKNFRSIRDATVDLAPLTVIYGKNGSGKSSLLYGLLTLRNFLSNPNQNVPSLFSYPSISLGGFNEVVFGHDKHLNTEMSLGVSNPQSLSANFTLSIGEGGGQSRIFFGNPAHKKAEKQHLPWEMPGDFNLEIAIPYSGSASTEDYFEVAPKLVDDEFSANYPSLEGQMKWNGLAVTVQPEISFANSQSVLSKLGARTNLPMEVARQTGFVPLRRGFSKPAYSFTGTSPYLVNEDDLASFLAAPVDKYLHYKISDYFEEITECRVQVQTQLGTTIFTVDVIPKDRGTPVSIVNEGFGLNQLLYLLTICLHPNYKVVAIEEPEIPSPSFHGT